MRLGNDNVIVMVQQSLKTLNTKKAWGREFTTVIQCHPHVCSPREETLLIKPPTKGTNKVSLYLICLPFLFNHADHKLSRCSRQVGWLKKGYGPQSVPRCGPIRESTVLLFKKTAQTLPPPPFGKNDNFQACIFICQMAPVTPVCVGLPINTSPRVFSDIGPGADPRGGGSWGSGPPPPFWGTPKLHKEGKNVPRVRAKTPHFST